MLSPDQFQTYLFAPASQLMDPTQTASNEASYYRRGNEDLWHRKELENRKSGLVSSIREHGIQTPVEMSTPQGIFEGHLSGVKEHQESEQHWYPDHFEAQETGKPMVWNGHHRITAANKIDPSYEVPVQWER